MGAIEMLGQVPAPFVCQRANQTLEWSACRMRRSMLLQFGWPTTHKVTFYAFQGIVRIAQIPLFVLLSYVRVSWRTFAAQFALILIVMVLQEVLVDVIDHVELLVAHRAHKQLLIVRR